jgi:hypothetical protein
MGKGGAQIRGVEFRPHVHLHAGGPERFQDPSAHLLEQFRLGFLRGLRHVVFLECNNPAATNGARQAAQYTRGVRDIEQYKPPDDGVECSVWPESRQIRFHKSCVRHAVVFGAPTRGLHGRGRSVDAQHRPAFANQSRRQERHVAEAAPRVQHVHSRRKTRAEEQILRQVFEKGGLLREAPRFCFRIAGRIAYRLSHRAIPIRRLRQRSATERGECIEAFGS